MTVGTIIALAVIVPVILIPVALVWYINVGGIYQAMKEARERRVEQELATQKTKA